MSLARYLCATCQQAEHGMSKISCVFKTKQKSTHDINSCRRCCCGGWWRWRHCCLHTSSHKTAALYIRAGSSQTTEKLSLPPTNVACTMYSNVTYFVLRSIWYHADRHEQWKKVISPVFFFFYDLGLALATKTCPRLPQAFKKVNNSQAFSSEESLFFLSFSFLGATKCRVPQGTLTERFRANIRRSDFVGPILSHIYRPKIILYWN